MDICVDFDGTCTTHNFPEVGEDIGATSVLKKLTDAGHRLILFTMRSDIKETEINSSPEFPGIKGQGFLTNAVNWFKENNIPLYGIQSNPTQKNWTTSPKAYGELYIDDAALGCPLKWDLSLSKRPYVDWVVVENWLVQQKIL